MRAARRGEMDAEALDETPRVSGQVRKHTDDSDKRGKERACTTDRAGSTWLGVVESAGFALENRRWIRICMSCLLEQRPNDTLD